ncbi:O-methyltransferase [bacterium]|nr:O-methyltransferase [bacterium]
MSGKFVALTPELHAYVAEHRSERDPVLAGLAQETARLGRAAAMQVSPEQGAFLSLLVRAIGARRALEVGTFTGYGAVSIARGLPDDGRLLCCDVSEEWSAIARRAFERAGVAGRVELRVAPALETLRSLPAGDTFDFAFVDADKTSYRAYHEEILPRLRVDGLIVFDNVLWSGAVVDPSDRTSDTVALRELNDFLPTDPRVECVMIPLADGLTIARKRGPNEGARR